MTLIDEAIRADKSRSFSMITQDKIFIIIYDVI